MVTTIRAACAMRRRARGGGCAASASQRRTISSYPPGRAAGSRASIARTSCTVPGLRDLVIAPGSGTGPVTLRWTRLVRVVCAKAGCPVSAWYMRQPSE